MTSPQRPSPVRPVEYKGEPLDAERGPGLGCFWLQLAALGLLIVLTPVSVTLSWPPAVSAGLLFATILLLLFAGQTVIFLLRLVAADRRDGRRRPLGSATRTVGELEDEADAAGHEADARDEAARDEPADPPLGDARAGSPPDPAVRE